MNSYSQSHRTLLHHGASSQHRRTIQGGRHHRPKPTATSVVIPPPHLILSVLALLLGLLSTRIAFYALAQTWPVTQLGPLKLEVKPQPTFEWPYDIPRILIKCTNTGASAINGIQYHAIKNNVEIIAEPNPPMLWIEPGQTISLSAMLDEASGLGSLPRGVNTVVVTWSFGTYGSLTTSIKVAVGTQPGLANTLQFSGRVFKAADNRPLTSATVRATAGTSSIKAVVNAQGMFTLNLLKTTPEWVVSFSNPGYVSQFVFVNSSAPPTAYRGKDIRLVKQGLTVKGLTYSPAIAKDQGVPYWQGIVVKDKLLLTPGDENWTPQMLPFIKNDKVMLTDVSGSKVYWSKKTGQDAWGGDLSLDGKWATYVTGVNPRGSQFTLWLVDAVTGNVVWNKDLRSYPSKTQMVDSKEVRFSLDAASIAVGYTLGDLLLVNRATGALKWSIFIPGAIRSIKMHPDKATMIVVTGTGITTRVRLLDGSRLWTSTSTISWTHQTGLKISPDGTKIGLVAYEGTITMLDAANGRVLWQVQGSGRGHWAGFSRDGTVFVASTLRATYGFKVANGAKIFRLPGSNTGMWSEGSNRFVMVSDPNSSGVYDATGTRVSNILPGIDYSAGGNYYFAWISADGLKMAFAQRSLSSGTGKGFFVMSGKVSALPTV